MKQSLDRSLNRRWPTSSLTKYTLACLVTLLVAATHVSAQPPPLAPDSVLAVSASSTEHVLAEFSPDGEVLGQVDVLDPTEILGTPSGLTRLDGEFWISGASSIHRIDPATGEIDAGFTASDGPTLTALCTDGEFLLAGEFTANSFLRFDTDGNHVDTIVLDSTQLFLVGADSDGEFLYVGSHATGDVHIFDLTGAPVGVIDTNQGANISAVSLGQNGDTIWVATGLGVNEIQEFDFDGNLLRTFDGQFQLLMGLYALQDGVFGDGFESGDLLAWSLLVP